MRGVSFVVACVFGGGCVITAVGSTRTSGGAYVETRPQPPPQKPGQPAVVTPSGNPNAITMLALGEGSTCSLSAAGQIRCWGRNYYGALGTGSREANFVDGYVTGIDGQVTAIAAGGFHQCALTAPGDVWCWGSNLEGAIGNGSVGDSEHPVLKPVRVAGISRVKSLHLGDKISCALTQDSSLYCWGRNAHHEIDSSSTKMITSPTRVTGTGRVDLVAVGNYHLCYATDGRVQCTGNLAPVNADAAGLRNVTGISAGYQHSCAIHDGGKVSCWGGDYLGVLGQGDQCPNKNDGGECVSKMRPPALVPGIAADPVQIAGNTYHTCVRYSSGGVTCFGNNQGGAFSSTLPKEPWQKAFTVEGVVADQIYVGGIHVCTMRAGVARCGGNDGSGAVSGGH